MTISIQLNSLKVTLTKTEETYVRARFFQLNAKKLGLANQILNTFLDSDNNPIAFTILHDAIHQLYSISTDTVGEQVAIGLGIHIMYSSPFGAALKVAPPSKAVKDLLTGQDSDDAYAVYANLYSIGI